MSDNSVVLEWRMSDISVYIMYCSLSMCQLSLNAHINVPTKFSFIFLSFKICPGEAELDD